MNKDARSHWKNVEVYMQTLTSEDLKPMEEWLSEYTKKGSLRHYRRQFQYFLYWSKTTPKKLVADFDNRMMRSLILKYQAHLLKGYASNTARMMVNIVRAFFTSQCEPIRGLKRKVVSVKKAKGEHVFSLSDLQKVWHIADTRDKAIISVGASLGWEASAFLNMERDFFESLVKRARDQNLDFIGFEWQREKTGAEQYGILTPCAIDSLERWLSHKDNKAKATLWSGLTSEGLNKILKRLVEEANIVTIGRVRWHLLRKFLMATLSKSGLNEWEVKIILGKAIPTTDLTYLQTLKESAFEKYREAYPQNMSLVSYSNGQRKIENIEEILKIMAKGFTKIVKEAYEKGQTDFITQQELETIETMLALVKQKTEEVPEE